MIDVLFYNGRIIKEWDNFVSLSKNANFLFNRSFIEYHKDRIIDYSFVFFKGNNLIGLFPANKKDDTCICSHQGLTYGGVITNSSMTTKLMLDVFDALLNFLSKQGFTELIYKPIPHIYHKLPAEEDLYALYRNHAELVSRSISSCIYAGTSVEYSLLRKRGIKKALNGGLKVCESKYFGAFWRILEDNLMNRHAVKPVHTLSEIEYLHSKFSNSIRLFITLEEDQPVAGCVTFETHKVIHTQYISASERGRQLGALDLLFDTLIERAQSENKHFDFGTSTEQGGLILNEGLVSQKEGFGARGVVYDIYKIKL